MDREENGAPFRGFIKEPFSDRHFLLNFIVGTYLGPDVYSDNPRCSAAERLAKGSQPYTSNNLGDSSLCISQLVSLYYYVLRNAHPSLVFDTNMFYEYLKGRLVLLSSEPPEDCRQFTSFFPLSIHAHKRYSPSYETVKGIVLIEDPVTSYMKREYLERFKSLSGMDNLKIDVKKCLKYEHGSQKGGEENEQICMGNSEVKIARTISTRSERSPAMFRETYKRRRCCHTPKVSASHCGMSTSTEQNEESISEGSYKFNGPATTSTITAPKWEDHILDDSVILTGTARKGIPGPPIGIIDIGTSKSAYFFRVALPGVRRDFCEFSCEIETDGKVHIEGTTSGGMIIRKRSRVFHMKFQQMCPPGPFTLTFNLPGPVDPRLFSPKFRNDGIFEAVVIKKK